MNRDDLLAALTHDNIGAWLHLLREGESSNDESAWTVIYGGKHFTSFDDHPRIFIPLPNGQKSSAAGAFQITATTWGDYIKNFGPQPFTPENQALCAVWLTARRKALDAVIGGRLHEAIRLCVQEWTSLATQKLQAQASSIFAAYGGREDVAAVSSSPSITQEVNKPMLPLIPILLETLVPMIPQIAKLLGSGSEVSNRNNAILQVAADKIVEATGAINLQDAVSKAQNDPAALDAVKQAVSDVMFQVGEAGGGGLDGARKAAQTSEGDWRKVVFSGPFVLAIAVMPLIYAVVFAALLKFDWLAEITSEVRTGVITSVTGLILGSLMGYFYGTSASSAKKDALLK